MQRGSLCVAVTSGSDGCVRRWAGEQLSSAGRCRLLKNGTVVKCCLIDDSEDDDATLCATERGTVLTCVPGADDKKNICRSPAKTVDQSKVAAVVVTGHFAPVTCLAAHPSHFFRDVRFRFRVITWDADQGSKLRHTSLESCGSAIKYDEKGRYLFVGSEQGTVSILDASTLDIIRTHNVFKCPVTSISASPDSKLITACSRRGDVVVLDENGFVFTQERVRCLCDSGRLWERRQASVSLQNKRRRRRRGLLAPRRAADAAVVPRRGPAR